LVNQMSTVVHFYKARLAADAETPWQSGEKGTTCTPGAHAGGIGTRTNQKVTRDTKGCRMGLGNQKKEEANLVSLNAGRDESTCKRLKNRLTEKTHQDGGKGRTRTRERRGTTTGVLKTTRPRTRLEKFTNEKQTGTNKKGGQ